MLPTPALQAARDAQSKARRHARRAAERKERRLQTQQKGEDGESSDLSSADSEDDQLMVDVGKPTERRKVQGNFEPRAETNFRSKQVR